MSRQPLPKRKYDAARILFKSSSTIAEVMSYLEIAKETAQRIKHSETYEEYLNSGRMAAYHAMKKQQELERQEQEAKALAEKAKEEQKKQEVKEAPVQSGYQMNRLIQIMNEQNEILRVMSNKIAFIVDELTK